MISPQVAAVRPRVFSPEASEPLPLVDVVTEILSHRRCRDIQIVGGPGAGKTTALQHLAAALQSRGDAVMLDDASPEVIATHWGKSAIIHAHYKSRPIDGRAVLRLASWTEDDFIEYLLARHKDQCGKVMARITADEGRILLEGNPSLWKLVLDEFAADPALSGVRAAIDRVLARALPGLFDRWQAGKHCLALLLGKGEESVQTLTNLTKEASDFDRLRPLRHRFVQCLLAADRIVGQLMRARPGDALAEILPPPLVEEVARRVRADRSLAPRLEQLLLETDGRFHPMAASILFAAQDGWRPPDGRRLQLERGRFARAQWAGIWLDSTPQWRSSLFEADLQGANLAQSRMDNIVAYRAHLSRANLREASLVGIQARQIDFSGADLTGAELDKANLAGADLRKARFDDASLIGVDAEGADLRGASFRNTNLAYSVLLGCQVAGADFSHAHLLGVYFRFLRLRDATFTGACFTESVLSRCDLEEISWPDALFNDAKLDGALLTGSVLPRADFRNADLRGAGLADIHWEDADLREADLRGCTFHMGSTRSGLVGSPYPGHGSKTGFYTDDYYDQGYKRPEEIRKANLRGADLRGAKLDGVDFYLVDLRDAKFDADAAEHLQRCGAILAER